MFKTTAESNVCFCDFFGLKSLFEELLSRFVLSKRYGLPASFLFSCSATRERYRLKVAVLGWVGQGARSSAFRVSGRNRVRGTTSELVKAVYE